MKPEEYFQTLASQGSDEAKRALWLRRSVKSPSVDNITLSQNILKADGTAFEDILTRLTLLEIQSMQKVDSLSGQATKAQRQTAWSSVWAARATMSVAILTTLGRPILIESQLAHGHDPREIQHLKNKPVLEPEDSAEWHSRPLAYRKQSADWRKKSVSFRTTGVNLERSFLLTELVSMAYQAYLTGDPTWPLRREKPWYLDWEQVQKIPGLRTQPGMKSKLEALLSSQPITQAKVSAMHKEPYIYVTPMISISSTIDDEHLSPPSLPADRPGTEAQRQTAPTIQVSEPSEPTSSMDQPPDWQSVLISGLAPLPSVPPSPVPSDMSVGSGYGSGYHLDVDSFDIDG